MSVSTSFSVTGHVITQCNQRMKNVEIVIRPFYDFEPFYLPACQVDTLRGNGYYFYMARTAIWYLNSTKLHG